MFVIENGNLRSVRVYIRRERSSDSIYFGRQSKKKESASHSQIIKYLTRMRITVFTIICRNIRWQKLLLPTPEYLLFASHFLAFVHLFILFFFSSYAVCVTLPFSHLAPYSCYTHMNKRKKKSNNAWWPATLHTHSHCSLTHTRLVIITYSRQRCRIK